MSNSVSLYKSVMAKIKKNNTYNYQLTKWLDRGELDEVIQQIETYEGEGKGYYIGERGGKWAVFTKGDLVVDTKDFKSYKGLQQGELTLLQYRDMVRLAKRGM